MVGAERLIKRKLEFTAESQGKARRGQANGLRRYGYAALVAAMGLIVTLVVFKAVSGMQQNKIKSEFDRFAGERVISLRRGIEDNIQELYAIRSFFDASQHVDREEFATFVEPLLAQCPGIRTLQWVPRVPGQQRAAYEQSAWDDGYSGFRVIHNDAGPILVDAPQASEYYPVYYAIPSKDSQPPIGLDLASNPGCLEAMLRARDTGLVAATQEIIFAGAQGTEQGMLLFVANYRNGAQTDTVEQRRENLFGFVLGVLRVDVLLEVEMADFETGDVEMRVIDETASSPGKLLAQRVPEPDASTRMGRRAPIRHEAMLDVGGGTWKIVCAPTAKFMRDHASWNAMAILAGGSAISIVLACYYLALTGRTLRVERVVEERTAQLLMAKSKAEEAVEALRRREERFDLAIKGSTDGLWDWDVVTNEVYYSSRFKELIGYSDDEVENVFASFESRLHPDDHDRVLEAVREHLENRVPYDVEYRLRTKPGSYRWYRARGQALWIESGRPIRMAGSMQDISKRKQAEQELKTFAVRLQRSNIELEEFARVASHDLQEPLRKVQMFGDRLKAKYAELLPEEGCDYIERMHKATVRMQGLINDLLTYSRVSTETQPFQTIDLGQLVSEVVSDLEVRINETGGRVNIGKLPEIEADPTQVRQLFQNLIGNGLKYHRPGEAPVVRVDAHIDPSKSVFSICVMDNGIGFEMAYLDRIFAVFQRLHGRSEYEGAGVGLAICKKIVERHGGTITAKSKPGAGSTFVVELPVQTLGEVDRWAA